MSFRLYISFVVFKKFDSCVVIVFAVAVFTIMNASHPCAYGLHLNGLLFHS